jgi:hypothetical protein
VSDYLAELRRPFSPSEVKFKPQAVSKDQTSGLAVFFVDARLVAERLNQVVGIENWWDSYAVLGGPNAVAWGTPVECSLWVNGVTKVDVGQLPPHELDEKSWKSAYSDAFKRAAVKFGVGAHLYAAPNIWASTVVRDGKARGFDEAGIRKLRQEYEKWLRSSANTFGAPFGDAAPSGDGGDAVPPATPDQHEKIAVLADELAELRSTADKMVTPSDVTAALEKDYGSLVEITQARAEEAIGQLKQWRERVT